MSESPVAGERTPGASRGRRALLACALALGAVPASPMAWAVEPSAEPVTDCADARLLPPGADAESRRITCEIPEKYREEVSMAQFIGGMIRLHDMAAWVTSDALQEAGAFKDVPGEGQGWLTHPQGEDVEVRYFTLLDGQTTAVASARMDGANAKAVDARRLSPPEPMSEREARLMKAKLDALATQVDLCTPYPPNTVVFETDEGGRQEILVFVMSAWKEPSQSPLGGYHMFRYTPDGQTQVSHFSQTRSCLVADTERESSDGFKPAYLAVTHLTSATPTMFHVFMSLQYRKPLFVRTTQNEHFWRVERGRIHLLPQQFGASAESTPSTQSDHAGSDR